MFNQSCSFWTEPRQQMNQQHRREERTTVPSGDEKATAQTLINLWSYDQRSLLHRESAHVFTVSRIINPDNTTGVLVINQGLLHNLLHQIYCKSLVSLHCSHVVFQVLFVWISRLFKVFFHSVIYSTVKSTILPKCLILVSCYSCDVQLWYSVIAHIPLVLIQQQKKANVVPQPPLHAHDSFMTLF